MRALWFLLSLVFVIKGYAFSWTDLWSTKNQQAQVLMQKGKYKEAEFTFQHPQWRAAATYRAGDYKKAARRFQALQNERGFYNQGNALARMGKYDQAIKAYDAALAINSKNQDALYNRKLLQDLLKKNQNQQDKEQQNKNSQEQNQQDKNQQNKDQQGQNQQDNNQQNKDQQGQNQQDKNQPSKDQPSKDQPSKDQPDPPKQDKMAKEGAKAVDKSQTPEEVEKQLAKEQWLRLIPDDPAGLMREKFLRDHLRREEGWYQ
ncbi:MAG: tetratricopeptide repeat protein [Tatlockia sp.]|nr:tetratricopeptide repeat protein [Tatlockia sp.]